MAINLQKIGDPTLEQPAEFPVIHDANIDALTTKVDEIETSIIDLEGIVNNDTNNITTLQNNIVTINSSIAGLTSQIENISGVDTVDLELRINVLETQVATISADIASNTALLNLETRVDTISSNVQTNTTSIENISSAAIINTSNINALQVQTTNIENNVSDNTTLIGSISAVFQGQLDSIVLSGGSVIGFAEDGDYTDGLFDDFTQYTSIGIAIDRFNEVLKLFAPPSPPTLNSMGSNIGEIGKVSYDENNVPMGYSNPNSIGITIDVNDIFNTTSPRRGIFDSSTVLQGTLADNVPAHAYSYPANAFSYGDRGILELIVNDSILVSIDLSSPNISGSLLNINGSGFIITPADAIKFENGKKLNSMMYRTGTWQINPDDLLRGYNTVQVKHIVSGDEYITQKFEYFIDEEVTIPTLLAQGIISLIMKGITYLSGVKYHTIGDGLYNLQATSVYDKTYSTSNITFGGTRINISDESIPPATDPSDVMILASKAFTIDTSNRIFGLGIELNTNIPKTLGRSASLTSVSGYELLVDPNIENYSGTNNTTDTLNTELYRVNDDVYTNQTNLRNNNYNSGGGGSGSPFVWNSTANLIVTANHSAGLLQYNGRIVYPSSPQVINSGNFSLVANGPSANVNYANAHLVTSTRTYLRYFYFSGDSKSNFSLKILRDGTTDFISAASGPSGQNLTVEVLLPNGTTDQDGANNLLGNVEFKDPTIAFAGGKEGDIGCGWDANKIPGHDYGIKFGTRGTFMSGGAVVVRIKAASSWSGYIESIELNDV